MNIAFVALAPFISGSERSFQIMLNIVKEDRDNKCIIICPKTSPMNQWARDNNIPYFNTSLEPFALTNIFQYILEQLFLYRVLKQNKIQIVHSNQIYSIPPLITPCALAKVPLVSHFRDPIDTESNWWIKKNISGAIAISNYIDMQLCKNLSAGKVKYQTTIINPVNIPAPVPNSKRLLLKKKAKERHGIKAENFVFGYIGQIASIKRVYELIDAFSSSQFSNDILIIAGTDPSEEKVYLNSCIALAKDRGVEKRIIWLGHIDDVSIFYHSIDVVMLLSKREPLGRVPLEAGAHHVPAIVANVDGLPETIDNNKGGWLVNATDQKEIVKVMEAVRKYDIQQCGKHARHFVESTASPSAFKEKLYSFYKRILHV